MLYNSDFYGIFFWGDFMTHYEIFKNAEWIEPQENLTSAIFRDTFEIKDKKARIFICGLGYFTLYINGKRVSDDELVPAYTDYLRRERSEMKLSYPLRDKMDHRIYVMEYDISKFIKKGKNVIGVMLGGGYFHQTDRKAEGNMDYGNIRLCFRITSGSDEFVSSKSTLYKQGFIKKSSLYYGEEHDYNGFDYNWNTLEANPDGWKEPVINEDTEDVPFYIQDFDTDKVVKTVKPVKVHDFGDHSLYDCGINLTGYPVVKCEKAGEKISLKFAENINNDFTLNCRSAGYEQIAYDEFITDGITKEFYPRFLWHGFRYFTLSNNAAPVKVCEVHTDLKVTSGFECSDDTINWLYNTYIHTQLSNVHSAVPSDCPHRERLGYTGDGQLCAGAGMLSFDSQAFYKKWIYDIIDCQDKTTGHVQHTAPFAGGGGGPAGWGGAIISVVYHYVKYFGDTELLEDVYDNMMLYVKYMESRCKNGIVVKEEPKGWCLGDWCTPEKIEIPEPYVNTCLYITHLVLLRKLAVMVNKNTSELDKLITMHKSSIIQKYFPDDDMSFLGGIQGADAFAADCGIAGYKTLEMMNRKYGTIEKFDTGIFGTYYLIKNLFKAGFADTAIKLLKSEIPDHSFGWMKLQGATTLWENWNGEASHNHPMFGGCVKYLYENILGIVQGRNSIGFDEIVISPSDNHILDYAKGFVTTVKGKIAVEYQKKDGGIDFVITLDKNMEGIFIYKRKKYKLAAGKNKFTF